MKYTNNNTTGCIKIDLCDDLLLIALTEFYWDETLETHGAKDAVGIWKAFPEEWSNETKKDQYDVVRCDIIHGMFKQRLSAEYIQHLIDMMDDMLERYAANDMTWVIRSEEEKEHIVQLREQAAQSLMTIAEQVRASQDTKEMTRRAIKILITAGEDASDLIAEFKATYGEEV